MGLLAAPLLKTVPIAVLGMKTDLKSAVSEHEFRTAMGLLPEAVANNVTELFMCSVVEMEGAHRVGDAIQWLCEHIPDNRIFVPGATSQSSAPAAVSEPATVGDDEDMMV